MASHLVMLCYIVFFFAFLLSYGIEIRTEPTRDTIIRAFIIMLMAAIWFVGPVIDGLEYEDAYVHLAAAKFQLAHAGETDGFYVMACAAGSARDCAISVTFGTQMIGYSTLLAMILHTGLAVLDLSNIVSYVAAVLSVQIMWSLLRKQANTPVSLFCISLILTAPSFYIMSGSSFAEPLYMLFSVCFLFYSINIMESSKYYTINNSHLVLFTSGLLMILVKKEGLLLVGVILAWSLWIRKVRGATRYQAEIVTLICASIIGISIILFQVFEADVRHSADIGTAAFDFRFIPKLLPVIMDAGSRPSLFGILWLVGAVLVPFALVMRERTPVFMLFIIGGFVVVYSVHARHSAFVRGESVSPEEMVRYLYTLCPFVAIFCATVLKKHRFSEFVESISSTRRDRASVLMVSVLGLGLCLIQVDRQRLDFASDEFRGRPVVRDSDRNALLRSVVVSPFSLVLFAKGPANLLIVDKSIVWSPAAQRYLAYQSSLGRKTVDLIEGRLLPTSGRPVSPAGR